MPANLSPEYKEAEAAYRQARDPEERLKWLKEMLRTIPKHKGTEHLQADLKTRIKQLSEEAQRPKKGARTGPAVAVRSEGAAQIAMLGPPNAGKSALHSRLTGSGAMAGPAPFLTQLPQPGMLRFEDIQFQLVDLPAVSARFWLPWMPNALAQADGALLIVDISDPNALDDVEAVIGKLSEKRIVLSARPLERASDDREEADRERVLPTLLVAAKCDLLGARAASELEVFSELSGSSFPSLLTSTETGENLEALGKRLFDLLEVVRVYTKVPGRPAEKARPFTLRRGASVGDVARLVHRGLAGEVKSARIWGSNCYPGQQVGAEHVVCDGDVIELHW